MLASSEKDFAGFSNILISCSRNPTAHEPDFRIGTDAAGSRMAVAKSASLSVCNQIDNNSASHKESANSQLSKSSWMPDAQGGTSKAVVRCWCQPRVDVHAEYQNQLLVCLGGPNRHQIVVTTASA